MSPSLIVWAAAALIAAAVPAAKPNVLLITVDTLRADVLGYAGGAAKTPFFDALAADSWRFDGCYAAAMLTNPAHASLMTSLYPRDHGVYDNDSGIADGVPTLASQLAAQGYSTAAIVNFPHLNPEVSNLGQGFATVLRGARKERLGSEMSAQALALLQTLPEPWFVWLHYTDPHSPYDPPQDIVLPSSDAFPDASMQKVQRAAPGFQKANPWFKKTFRSSKDARAVAARYLGEVENTDRALGSLWDGLVAQGLSGRTVFAVTSDHGENLGEHDLFFHHGGLYRSTVHVPWLLRVPGEVPRVLSGLVQSVDIAPTLLALTGTPGWSPMRGRSLVAYARGTGTADLYAFSEHMLGQMASVRSDAGTLIVHRRASHQFPSYPIVKGTREFFAATDIAEAHPTTVPAELEAALQTFLRSPAVAYKPRAAPVSNHEDLRALGYVE